MMVGGSACLLGFIVSIVELFHTGSARALLPSLLEHYALAILYLSVFVYSITILKIKESIREAGILVYGQFIRWRKIEQVRWAKSPPSTLVLNIPCRLPFHRTVYIRIPKQNRQHTEEVLKRIVPEKLIAPS